jgi:nucleotide-binding universal stress UspA family protein
MAMAEYRILVPLDGSALAESALGYVPLLASLGNNEAEAGYPQLSIRLLSVVDPTATYALPDPANVAERETHVLTEYLQGKQRQLEREKLPTAAVVRQGGAARSIVQEAEDFAANLIMLSTHGRSGFQRWRIGSVADKVIRMAPCDTLVVGLRSAKPGLVSIRSILVPLDGSELAEQALARGLQFASALKADLYVMRVISPHPMGAQLLGLNLNPDMLRAQSEAESYLEGIRERVRGTSTTVLAPAIGPAAQRILDYVAESSIDLVIMTSHGRGGVLRAALGSVTDRLLGGPAPVLVVHPQ